MKIIMSFSENLRLARLSKGYTLEELSKIYNNKYDGGLSKGTLSKYENGKQEPMISTVKKLSSVLDVTADYLLDKVNESDELNEYLQYLRTRPEMKMLFNLTKDATKEDVEKAVKVIEAMLGKSDNE